MVAGGKGSEDDGMVKGNKPYELSVINEQGDVIYRKAVNDIITLNGDRG